MKPIRAALLGLAFTLGLAVLAPSANAAVALVGVSGELSDAAGNVFSLDGGTAYMGLGSENDLSFTNAYLNLTEHEKLVIIDGGVVDGSHIVTFRLLSFPSDPLHDNPGFFRVLALDEKGNVIGVDSILSYGPPPWQPSASNDFWNTSFLTLNYPEVSEFTVDFPVPEPSTWALMMLGVVAIGASLRRRRAEALPAQL